MTMFDADVLFWNKMGAKGFTGTTIDKVGVGGSELEIVQVAESLAEFGYRCVVCSGDDYEACEVRGVRYEPWSWVGKPRRRFRATACWRMSEMPDAFAEKYIVRATDVASPPYAVHNRGLGQGWCELVGVTRWQLRGFPFARVKHVINPMMDGLDVEPPEKDPKLLIFASAPSKGLGASCAEWRHLKAKHPDVMGPMRLNIVIPGRSYSDASDLDTGGETGDGGDIELVGVPTVARYREEIAKAAGLFMVSTFQETYGNCAGFAEKFGGRAHVLALNGRCGLPEALEDGGRFLTTDRERFEAEFLASLSVPLEQLAPRQVVDRSRKALAPEWVRVLGL